MNSLSGVAAFLTSIAVAFVMTPVIVHAIGNRNYGIWELLVGLVGYLGLLEFGIGPALVRYIADAHARKDRRGTQTIFNTGLFTLCTGGVLGCLFVAIIALWPRHLLPIKDPDVQWITPLLLIFGLNLAASLLRIAISAYLLGLQAHRVVNSIQIVVSICQAFVIYGLLTHSIASPLIWMGGVMFLGSIAQAAVMILWIWIYDRGVTLSISAFDVSMMRTLLGYGVKNTVLGASEGTLRKLVGFSIAYTSGVAQIVYFAVPRRLVDYGQALSMELASPLTPYFADIAGTGAESAMRDAWIQTTRLLQVVGFGMAVATVGLGAPFIHIWMGAEYAEQGRMVLSILCAGLFAQALASNGIRILMSLARHGGVAALSAALAVVCFGLSIAFGKLWGIAGVAVAVSMYSVGVSIAELILVCRVLTVSLWWHIRVNVLPFLIPIVFSMVTLQWLHNIVYPDSYGTLLLTGSAGGAVYLVAIWFAVLRTAERDFLKRVVLAGGRDGISKLRVVLDRSRE